jgi:hypothetical protein
MKRFILLFTLLLTSTVFAATTPALRWYNLTGSQWSSATASSNFSTQDATCQYAFSASSHPSKGSVQLINNSCRVLHTNGATISDNPIFTVYACPPNTTRADGGFGNPTASTMCNLPTCPTGQIWSTVSNSCSQDCSPLTGQRSNFSINCSNGNLPSSVCMPNNCAAAVVDSVLAQNKTSACWFGEGTGKYFGQSCSGQPSTSGLSNPTNANPPPEDSPETKCIKQGKTFGTVNGVAVCVPKSSAGGAPIKISTETKTDTTEKDENGNQTSGSSTTKTELSQDGQQVITKETKKNEDGTESTTQTEQTKENFCEKNPNNSICKPEPDDQCEDNPDLPQCMKIGEPEEGGLIDTQARNVTYTPVQIASGGSCPPDKTVSVAGRAMTFSYSWLCQYASMFKPFMLAFAYLSAAMFLFSGLRGANT